MPMPAALQTLPTSIVIGRTMAVTWTGFRSPWLDAALERFRTRLERRTGMEILFGTADASVKLTIHCHADDPQALTPDVRGDYRLEVGPDEIRIDAQGPVGVDYALSTLLQLARSGADGFSFSGATIADQPRYRWRGILIDAARHFISIDGLKRQIDMMELLKLNVLHVHLSDAEGFRLESKTLPLLHRRGGHRQYYTQAEMRDVIAYAAERAVRIVPEFDVPAHTGSWLLAYPEFAAGDIGKHPENALAEEVMDPSNPALYRALDRFFGEIAALFPDSYVHIGGDEVNGKQWTESARISRFKKAHHLADNHALQAYFTRRIQKILAARGKRVIGWDEVLDDDLEKSILVQSWRSSTMTAKSVFQGYQTIVSAGSYLDTLLSADHLYAIDPADVNGFGIDPEQWRAIKALPNTDWLIDEMRLDRSLPLTDSQKQLIIGGEAALWGETVTEEMLDIGLWPRAAAYAERLWTPSEKVDLADMRRRLVDIDRYLAMMGAQHYGAQRTMLARLAPQDPDALVTLTMAIEPAKYFVRWHAIHDAKAAPQIFNQVADAAFPESMLALRIDLLVDTVIATPGTETAAGRTLRSLFEIWRANDARIQDLPQAKGVLADAALMSQDLQGLASLGLAALDRIEHGPGSGALEDPEATKQLLRQLAWQHASATPLAALVESQPPGEMFLAVAMPIQRLRDAALTRR